MTPVEQIKEKLDIVEFIRSYIQLIPAGRNFKAICPFHKEKTPSFIVSPERQTWHCFGACSEGGDIFKFVMKYENVEFYEALKILAEKAGVELRKNASFEQRQFDVLYDINDAARTFFKNNLRVNKEALEYLQSRGLREETMEEFDLGFALQDFDKLTLELLKLGFNIKDIERAGLNFKTEKGSYMDRFRGRIMFPIFNHAGKNVGFSARILPRFDNGDISKYINSPETPIYNKSKILYGFNKSKNFIKEAKEAVLMEGQMDILMSWQDGVKNVVASSGTALTPEHLKVLRRYTDNLIFCFDNDEAGLKAAEKSIDLANSFDFAVKLLIFTEAKDPAELIQKQSGVLGKLIKESETAMKFYFKRYLMVDKERSGANISELKQNLRIILAKIKNLASSIEKSHWLKELSIAANIREEALIEEMAVLKSEGGNLLESRFTSLKPRDDSPMVGGRVLHSENRKDLISQRLLSLMAIKKELANNLSDYLNYFSEDYLKIIEMVVKNEAIADRQLSELFDLINLRASFESQVLNQQDKDISAEFDELLRQLRIEHLKEKRQKLLKQIKDAEKNGNQEIISSVLREFDAVSKMIHN